MYLIHLNRRNCAKWTINNGLHEKPSGTILFWNQLLVCCTAGYDLSEIPKWRWSSTNTWVILYKMSNFSCLANLIISTVFIPVSLKSQYLVSIFFSICHRPIRPPTDTEKKSPRDTATSNSLASIMSTDQEGITVRCFQFWDPYGIDK